MRQLVPVKMKASIKRWPLAAAIASVMVAAGIGPVLAGPVVVTGDGPALGPDALASTLRTGFAQNGDSQVPATQKVRYIVLFTEAPLALYDGSTPGLAAIPRVTATDGRSKLDSKSPQAILYVSTLKTKQSNRVAAMTQVLGRSITPSLTMQHALNAVVVDLTASEAKEVSHLAGVKAVKRDVVRALSTDIGPQFIGATRLWNTPAGVVDSIFVDGFDGNQVPNRFDPALGDGVIVGDIDTGYNSKSPSFSATDDTGYTITNPLGAGNYLGQCGVANISLAGCNSKVIGVYDFIDAAAPFSVEDTQGHGSHTASTIAGNSRNAVLSGYAPHISGVAPHANLVVFYACSPAGCPDSATSGSVDQAVADGKVDVLNFSISGGTDPWNDVTSQAFLAATNAGIFVAAAGGNTSASVPAAIPGTVNHYEPWVITVAASTHTGGAVANQLSATGPGTPPPNTQNLNMQEGSGTAYTGFSAAIAPTTPLILSPNFQISTTTGTDGCTAYPANTFKASGVSGIALISRGTCGFSVKATNAQAAGAAAIVIADNRPEALFSPSLAAAAITSPTWIITQADAAALQTFLLANPATATGGVPYSGLRLPQQPDVLADFSLLGPTNINVIKPEVQAPGVDILAAVANDGSANGPNLVALFNGTSMATPHTTGSGALLLDLHPDWTPMEAKSALMMTAKEAGLTKPDGTTASGFFDRGAGRIQVDIANKAGLVLDESGTNFSGANPAVGGDPTTLNLPSMENDNCVTVTGASTSTPSCSFTRRVRGTSHASVKWTATVTGVNATVLPASFALTGPGVKALNIAVDASTYTDGNEHTGEVVLTPNDGSPALHMPVAVGLAPPKLSTASSLSIAIPASATSATGNLEVDNAGGRVLNVTNTNFVDSAANYVYVAVDQPSQGNFGDYNTFFTDAGKGSYASDNFSVDIAGTNLARITLPGFLTGAGTALSAGHPVHFRLYANAAGVPAGAPESTTAHNAAAVWSYDATVPHTGLSVAGGTISLDLATAGAPNTNLAPGTYWLEVYADAAFNANGGWAQFESTGGDAVPAQVFGPVFGDTDWSALTSNPGMAMRIDYKVACGAPWLSATPSSLTIGGLLSSNVTVTANSTLFASGSQAMAYLCLQSNDPALPVATVKVSAVQN